MNAYTENLNKNKTEKETYTQIFLMNTKILNKILKTECLQMKLSIYKLNIRFHYSVHTHWPWQFQSRHTGLSKCMQI